MIRKAVARDFTAIRECALAAYHVYVERIGREPAPMIADFAASIERGHLFVFEQHAAIAGFVVCYAVEDHFHLENVAVDPDFQLRGIGRSLIAFAEERALVDGFSRIELYTNARMTENLALYPRLGFERFDQRTEDGFDRVYFRKALL
jgi:ribosomal protein S18 acetylase RimI-like enzyme